MTRHLLPLALVAAACSASNALSGDGATPEAPLDDGSADLGVSLRVDVLPAVVREEGIGAAFRVLPQTFRPSRLTASDLSLGELELLPPVELTGSIIGYRTNPQIAVLPGTVEGVRGTVWLRAPDTAQSVFTTTGPGGGFGVWVVPEADYRLEVIPDDPVFPVWTTDLRVDASTADQEVDLGSGVPVYGRVESASGPVVGALVHVTDGLGLVSSSAVTDTFGLYQVRVTPGTWTVVCEGRDVGQDPTLTVPDVVVGDAGANVDLTYPTVLGTVLVEGRLLAEGGGNVSGTTVRFTAKTLTGFEEVGLSDGLAGVTASWVGETPVGDNGTILTRVVEGVYTVEVLPPANNVGPQYSPDLLDSVLFDATVNQLGQLTLTPLVPVTGSVRSEGGQPIDGAVVTCVESAFDQRYWTTVADSNGGYAIDLPEVQVDCDVTPPADRGLASTRITFDPADARSQDLVVQQGEVVTGSVTSEGAPEAFAVVNVYDPDGRLLGFGVTRADGTFDISVALTTARTTAK